MASSLSWTGMTANIFNIQKFSIYDGPGIRTLVFFKGCPLHCLWCANPEGKSHAPCTLLNRDLCVSCGLCATVCEASLHKLENGTHKMDSEKCHACGKCVAACPQRAIRLCGQKMTTGDIMAVILEDEIFYKTSGGGVTLGGGEPLAQPEAALELLKECKKAGLHTAIETCGHAAPEAIREIAQYTDLFLYDLKHMDSEQHNKLTGVGNQLILQNLAWLLDNGFKTRVRMPLVSGCNADMAEMRERVNFLARWRDCENFLGVDLLPYHKLGLHKYAQLNERYTLDEEATVGDDFLNTASSLFAKHGITASIIRH